MGVLPATGLGSVFQESVCTAAAVAEGGGLGGAGCSRHGTEQSMDLGTVEVTVSPEAGKGAKG